MVSSFFLHDIQNVSSVKKFFSSLLTDFLKNLPIMKPIARMIVNRSVQTYGPDRLFIQIKVSREIISCHAMHRRTFRFVRITKKLRLFPGYKSPRYNRDVSHGYFVQGDYSNQ